MQEQMHRQSVLPPRQPKTEQKPRLAVRRPVPSGEAQPSGAVQRKCACQGEDDGMRVERSAEAGSAQSARAPSVVQHAIRGGGRPLDPGLRRYFEPRLGRDLGAVRVHTGAQADASAYALQAKAYTVGTDVVFRQGAFSPETESGRWLLAHELAHVAQGSAGAAPAGKGELSVSSPGDRAEREADRMADAVIRGEAVRAVSSPSAEIHRFAGDKGATAPLPAQETTGGDDDSISMAPITGQGEPGYVSYDGGGPGGCDGLVLHGHTDGAFDGGRFTVKDEKLRRSKGCNCSTCVTYTGTLVTNYSVDVNIDMPEIPSDLTRCGHEKAKAFLDTVLGPHEQEHKRRLETYNGQTRRRISVTGCQEDIAAKVQAIQQVENEARKAKADKLNRKIDPFVRAVDCSGCYGYGEPDDPLNSGGFGPDDGAVRVRPGPVRTTVIKPRTPAKSP